MIDIGIKSANGKFKLRTTGIIIKDNKLLVQKSKKFDGYILPGGHIELGELSSNAIIREIKEETNLDVKIKHLICVNENTYGDKNMIFHEINYYYYLEPINDIETKEFTIEENDKGILKKQEYFWIDINELSKNNIKPIHIVDLIEKNINSKDLIISTNEIK